MPDQINTGPPELDQPALTAEGFSPHAVQRHLATVLDYARELRDKAVFIADGSKSQSAAREVTEQTVRAAAAALALTFGRPVTPRWLPYSMAGEFVATAALGYATGDLKNRLALALFSAIGGLLLLFLRLSKGQAE